MRTVVVSGLGAVTPLGPDAQATWRGLAAGRSAVRAITAWDASALPCRIGAWMEPAAIEALRARLGLAPEDEPRLVLSWAAVQEALAGAGLPPALPRARAGLWVGTRWAEADLTGPVACARAARRPDGSYDLARFVQEALARSDPWRVRRAMPSHAAAWLAGRLSLSGPALTLQTACTSSLQALGEAFQAVRRGEVDVALAGGVDLTVTPLGLQFYAPLGVLSRANDPPEAASRPFDALRDGFVLGDGAAFLVLEAEEACRARGARPLARVLGYGTACDAYRITDEPPDGRGARLALRRALDDAGLPPEAVDHVSAHATSTPMNDRVETLALKAVFGPHARRLLVSGIKSMLGHTISAAGALAAVAAALALREGLVPPTINQEVPDPECDLDYVPNQARRAPIGTAAVTGFGFGGHADVVLLGAHP